jgi:hypothetical protein
MRLWSISTTVRTPERVRIFLKVLKELEGEVWNKETQKRYQILFFMEEIDMVNQSQFIYSKYHRKGLMA